MDWSLRDIEYVVGNSLSFLPKAPENLEEFFVQMENQDELVGKMLNLVLGMMRCVWDLQMSLIMGF